VAAAGVSLALMAGVAAPLGYAATLLDTQRRLIDDLFVPGGKAELYNGRLNILLLGGDGGLNRRGIRTDSVSLASINVATGKTVVFSLPRNLQWAPFPPNTLMARQFPNGFPQFFFGIYTWAQENRHLFGKIHDPGALAVEQAVAQTLGVPVHYYALVNLAGFQKVVNALGGITLRVESRLPIGGGLNQITGKKNPILGYIEPGLQRMDGYRALWYARSREGSTDYARMDRQRCVFGAMLNELNPMTILKNYRSLADAIGDVIATDITQDELERLIDVSRKTKDAGIASVAFTNQLINSADPDIAYIRAKVAAAIKKSDEESLKPTPTPTPKATGKATAKPTKKPAKPTKTPTATPKPKPATPGSAVELKDTCRYE
jgi:LCP family protein required for cell wall assembly